MSVVRIVKNKNFITMGKYHLQEKKMSLKAIGLLSVMLSLPDEWDYSIKGLIKIRKESYEAIRTSLNELEQFGYLQRKRIIDDKGKFLDIEYTIYEKPITENPILEKPISENQIQYNNINNINNKRIEEINNKENIIKEFEKLWELYPKKMGKKDALRHYIKSRGKYSYEQIKQGIERYIEYIEQKNIQEQYIKYGSSWFNQECWNDTYNNQDLPSWFDKDIEKKEISKEEQDELDELLQNF